MTSKTTANDHNVEKYSAKGKFSTATRTKNIPDHIDPTLDNQKIPVVHRKISFKVKSTSGAKNRMHITTLSASRVQELTSKFNKMCNSNNGGNEHHHHHHYHHASPSSKLITYHPRKFNAIIQTSTITPKQLRNLEDDSGAANSGSKVIKIIKKPSVKRKPSFIRVTPSKNISDTIKMFEQKVPLTTATEKTTDKPEETNAESTQEPITNEINSTTCDIPVDDNIIPTKRNLLPNNSFLWRTKPLELYDRLTIPSCTPTTTTTTTTTVPEDTISVTSRDSYQRNYETILAKTDALLQKYKPPTPPATSSKSYVNHFQNIHEEDTRSTSTTHSYDNCSSDNYENLDGDDGDFDTYEQMDETVNRINDDQQSLYEQIGPERHDNKDQTLSSSPQPPHVDVQTLAEAIKRNSLTQTKEDQSNQSNLYESIYLSDRTSMISNRDSIISHDQQSNSLYGGKTGSDTSYSDKSDDWIDITTDAGKSSPALIM